MFLCHNPVTLLTSELRNIFTEIDTYYHCYTCRTDLDHSETFAGKVNIHHSSLYENVNPSYHVDSSKQGHELAQECSTQTGNVDKRTLRVHVRTLDTKLDSFIL